MASRTLRELTGLDQTPASLADATLILVDYQNSYTTGAMELEGWDAALDAAADLLERARAAGTTVIHVQHDGGEGSAYDIRAWSRPRRTRSSAPTWANASTRPGTRTSSSSAS
jgi:nicotinamidase-related amidase